MQFLLLIALTFTLTYTDALAKNALPYKKPRVVSADSGTADDFLRNYFSERVSLSPGLESHNEVGIDPTQLEVDAIRRFLDSENGKKVYFARYGMGDKRATEVLLRLKAAGIPTAITIDGNRALEIDFGSAPYSFDFANARWIEDADGRPNAMARSIDELLGAGYQFWGSDWSIYSQALYPRNDDKMDPIAHEKATILIHKDGTKVLYLSTANMSVYGEKDFPNPRVNRVIKITDPDIVDAYADHLDRLNAGLADSNEIEDATDEGVPFRKEYPDGTFMELAFTGGKYNPVERLIDFYDEMIRQAREGRADRQRVERIVFSAFLITNTKLLEKIFELMEIDRETKLDLMLDQKFAELYGWGIGAAAAGFSVFRPFGSFWAPKKHILDRTTVHISSADAVDPDGSVREKTTKEGAPYADKVYHDKTMLNVVRGPTDAESYHLGHTGSQNFSRHIDNSDSGLLFKTGINSPFARGIIDNVDAVAREMPDSALRANLAIIKSSVGNLTGHLDREITVQEAEALEDASLKGDYDRIITILRGIVGRPTTLTDGPSRAEVEDRLQKLEAFFAWYEGKAGDDMWPETRARRLPHLSILFQNPDLHPSAARSIVKGLLWDPERSRIEQTRLANEGLKILGIKTTVKHRREFVGQEWIAAGSKVIHWSIDWDDNVLFMPTRVILFEKSGGGIMNVSTGEFASIRHLIGNTSLPDNPWANYEVRMDPYSGSFRNFRSVTGHNHFLDDLKIIFENRLRPEAWQAPGFAALIEALKNKASARRTILHTARGHSREHFYEGLQYLQMQLARKENGGFKIHLPPIENIHLFGGQEDIHRAKMELHLKTLDDLQALAVDKGKTQRWGFLDDDPLNYAHARDEILEIIAADPERWANIDMGLIYTGFETKDLKPQILHIEKGGRAQAPDSVPERLWPKPTSGSCIHMLKGGDLAA